MLALVAEDDAAKAGPDWLQRSVEILARLHPGGRELERLPGEQRGLAGRGGGPRPPGGIEGVDLGERRRQPLGDRRGLAIGPLTRHQDDTKVPA